MWHFFFSPRPTVFVCTLTRIQVDGTQQTHFLLQIQSDYPFAVVVGRYTELYKDSVPTFVPCIVATLAGGSRGVTSAVWN